MDRETTEDRVTAALVRLERGKKWDARALLLDELRASSERRAEILLILDRYFPLSPRQQHALAALVRDDDDELAGALEVAIDAPDPRFTDALLVLARGDDTKALEALLRLREVHAAEGLEAAFPEPEDAVLGTIERIRAGATETDTASTEQPPPPADAREDELWGLVDDVRRADVVISGSSEPELKASARRKKPASRRVRRAR